MDVILHIGAHRTGTTTLQHCLHRNRIALAEGGTAVWTPERTRRGLFGGLIHRPDTVTPAIARRAARATGLIGIERARLASAGVERLIVSDENMMGSVRHNLRQSALYPDLAARLRRFVPAFGGSCRRVVLGIRSQDAFWASGLGFAVSQGHRMPGMLQLDRMVAQGRRWRDVVADIAEAFPQAEIVVWPFERFASRPDLQLALILGDTATPGPVAGRDDWHNPGPRRDSLRRLLLLRGEDEAALAIPAGDGRWMPFDVDHRAELRAQYAADLDWLRRGADGVARLIEAPEREVAVPRDQGTKTRYHEAGAGRDVPAGPVWKGRDNGERNIVV